MVLLVSIQDSLELFLLTLHCCLPFTNGLFAANGQDIDIF